MVVLVVLVGSATGGWSVSPGVPKNGGKKMAKRGRKFEFSKKSNFSEFQNSPKNTCRYGYFLRSEGSEAASRLRIPLQF